MELMLELCEAMGTGSICGLGKTAADPGPQQHRAVRRRLRVAPRRQALPREGVADEQSQTRPSKLTIDGREVEAARAPACSRRRSRPGYTCRISATIRICRPTGSAGYAWSRSTESTACPASCVTPVGERHGGTDPVGADLP